jgi:hypothetical protein
MALHELTDFFLRVKNPKIHHQSEKAFIAQ